MAGAGVLAIGGALVAFGAAEVVGLGVEEVVEDLFDGLADFAVEVVFDFSGVEGEDSLQILATLVR